ncbi:hypothetical protein D9M70_528820 [compost metagenome]
MIEAEGKIEGRIPIPCTFCIEYDRAIAANQNVFWTDVPVNECGPRVHDVPRQCKKRCSKIRMHLRRRFKIGLDANRVKDLVIGEPAADILRARGRRMDRRDNAAQTTRERYIDAPVAQLLLPDGIFGRIEIAHGKCTK